MIETGGLNPNNHGTECEKYLRYCLESDVRFIHAEPLPRSTRDALWRLDVEVRAERKQYVLQLDSRRSEHEYAVLRAMESVQIPTPHVYGRYPEGEVLGVPCFLRDFIEGESLLQPMLAGERWAEELYIDTTCALQGVTRQQLSVVKDQLTVEETAEWFLEEAYEYFKTDHHPVAEAVYLELKRTMPETPTVRFSNGDLWLDNLIVRDKKLAGVIDFENAGFSDPVYEFLLPFFVLPQLRGRGVEDRYCERMGFDVGLLGWYRGLEYFDTWHWVEATGKPFEQYTSENLRAALENWLERH